jgi:hypothetical protein
VCKETTLIGAIDSFNWFDFPLGYGLFFLSAMELKKFTYVANFQRKELRLACNT